MLLLLLICDLGRISRLILSVKQRQPVPQIVDMFHHIVAYKNCFLVYYFSQYGNASAK